jgi:DNA topoisomerase-2
LVLVNGVEGIGTGWSTTIPSYNPHDITENLKRLLRGEKSLPMSPWYRHFKGSIDPIANKPSFLISGTVQRMDDLRIEITELPIGKWTQDYKEVCVFFVSRGLFLRGFGIDFWTFCCFCV